MDRERRYVIATAANTAPGAACERTRWRQVGGRAERVTFTVEYYAEAEVYYSGWASIDGYSRCPQDD